LVSDYGTLDWSKYGTVIFTLNNDNIEVKELQLGEQLTVEYNYTVSDGGEETSSSLLKIIIKGKDDIISNNPPVANNDQFTIREGEDEVSGNLLLNDNDADEDILTVTQINNTTDTTVIVSGNYGKVVWMANGNFRYILDETSKAVFNLTEGQTLTDEFDYYITDSKGGNTNAKFTITIIGINNSDDLIALKAFSPNGDGVNDVFAIKNIEKYPVNELFVYNRWGTKVHYQRNYNNTWGGLARQNGKLLPVGTYYYVLILNNNKKNIIKGYVYIKY
jgi:gliding motility-associated-like protein